MLDEILKWIPVVTVILTGMAAWIAWSVKRGLVSHEELDSSMRETRHEMTEISNRLIRVEAELNHIPTRDSINDLASRIYEMNGCLSGVKRQLDLLLQHHMKPDDKS
ncbi:MAG: hypothetical protein HQL64_06700 [Magnetococcales bacterium]|nr:hypothetical protein [Magnetococcales bacterium]